MLRNFSSYTHGCSVCYSVVDAMKRLIFSDVHLHPFTYGATTLENGYNSRLWSQWRALDEILQYLEEHEDIKRVYCGGDLFHTPGNIPTAAMQIAGWFADNLKDIIGNRGNLCGDVNQLITVVGNHDRSDKAGNVHCLNLLGHTSSHGVFMLDYTENEDEIKRFFERISKLDYNCMALMHQGVSGVPLASGYVLDERLTPEMIPDNCHVFTGHYHFHRQVSPNLTVIGNLTAINWNDIDQEKGFLVWDDETDVIEFIPTHAPKFITYDPLKSVENCFVRHTGSPKPSDIPDIRKALIDKGALTVEFPVATEKRETTKFNNNFDLQQMVAELDELDLDPRRKEVGVEVREGRYEA